MITSFFEAREGSELTNIVFLMNFVGFANACIWGVHRTCARTVIDFVTPPDKGERGGRADKRGKPAR